MTLPEPLESFVEPLTALHYKVCLTVLMHRELSSAELLQVFWASRDLQLTWMRCF